jgi:opacity protein-like surface antigen
MHQFVPWGRMMFEKRVALLIVLNVFGGAAWAAELPLKAPAAPAYYDWTGFYLGGNLGAANGTTSFSDTIRPLPSTFSSSNPASFIGGGQLGINYEFRSGLVVGAEAMFDWLANALTTFTASNLTAGTATGTINNRWITMATGKVGFAWDRLLVYGKAGGAWVGGTNNSFAAGGTPVGVSVNSSSAGWTAGAGVEWAFAGNWSARAEYDFIGLQNQSFTVSGTPATRFAGDAINVNNRTIQMITAGLNYKFSPW